MIKPIACIVVILLASCATPSVRTIKVIGEARRFVAPTSASIRLTLECARPSPLNASIALDSILRQVQEHCRRARVDPKDVASEAYAVREHLVRRKSGPNTYDQDSSAGWMASAAMSIHVKGLTVLDSLVSLLTTVRGLSLSDVTFHLDSTDRVNDTLRRESTRDARARAESMAQSLGCSVGEPITIEDGVTQIHKGTNIPLPGERPRLIGIMGAGQGGDLLSGVGGIVQSAQYDPDAANLGIIISPGLFLVTRFCAIEFALLPGK
ncbi:MAG TPA: SIMPL domain-containing protein [Candidatus Didemnitutus sp.]|nr:SIMPL domain-containing protein [Candidatus Didemnitutus sp.]